MKIPIDPKIAALWIAYRARSLNSIASLSQWLSMLVWLEEIALGSVEFKRNTFFIKFIEKLRKKYELKNDTRLPFTIKHILDYTLYKMITPNTYWRIDIDILLEILIIQLFWFSM